MAFDLETAKPVGEEKTPKSGFDLSTAKPVTETGGGAALITPKQRSTPASEETKAVAGGERLKKIAETGAYGVPLGIAAPYGVMALGAGLAGFPPTAPLGVGLMEVGGMMRAAPVVSRGVTGLLSGLGEETAGQISEAKGQSKMAQEAWRFAGGGLTPELKNIIGYATKSAVAGLGLVTKGDISGIQNSIIKDLGKYGIEEKNLSPTQKQYIRQVAESIRGGAPSEEYAKKIYSVLEQGAEETVNKYNTQAAQLEAQAKELIDAAQQAATARSAQAQGRVNSLQSQFETSAKQLTDSAQERAQNILRNAEARAQQMRASAASQSQQGRQLQEIEAQDIIKKGRLEADAIKKDANARVNRLRSVAEKARTTGAAGAEAAQKAVSAVGEAQTPTQTGTSIRDAVTPIFENLKKVRSDNAEKLKGDAFSFAAMKEAKGQLPRDTEAFRKGVAEIDAQLKNTTLADIKNPLKRIRDAISPPFYELDGVSVPGKPAKFESLEQIRRFLRDRSYGLPAEGFDAINQIQAGKLADIVEGIQKEFSPGISKFLEQYRKDSEPLRVFKTKLGEALVGKEEFDMARFSTDPATLGSKFFKSETGIKDLVTLLGGDVSKAEGIARGYVADQLRTANSKQIQQKMIDWRDWLPQFPALEGQLKTAAERMAQAEKIGAKREKISDVLRTEATKLPETAATAARRVETDAEKLATKLEAQGRQAEADLIRKQEAEAQRVLSGAEREAGGIVRGAETQAGESARVVERQKGLIETEAERAGKAEVSEAERAAAPLTREAGRLTAEAERVRQQILGKKFEAETVRNLIMSGDQETWGQVGPMIMRDPDAKKAFTSALRQVIADTAPTAPETFLRVYRERIVPAMKQTGLLSESQLATLSAEVEQIRRTVDPTRKESLMNKVSQMVINSITGEAARGAATALPFIKR